MEEMAAGLGDCRKSPLAKGEWAGDVDLSLAYQRVSSVLQTEPGGLALEQVSSVALAGVMFCMGVKAPQLLSRSREYTLDARSDDLPAGRARRERLSSRQSRPAPPWRMRWGCLRL